MTSELLFAGKLLAPHAVKLAPMLVRRTGIFRWMVDRAVHRSLRIEYPRRAYRAFLKSISSEELMQPVELVVARLALRLDATFVEAEDRWSAREFRISTTADIVEATFIELLRRASPGDAAVKAEVLNRARSSLVVNSIVEIARRNDRWAQLDSRDISLYLDKQSWERRAIRLGALGVQRDLAHKLMAVQRFDPPGIDAGSLVIVTGPYGAGKSEVAEEWHRETIAELARSEAAPVPVWMNARELTARSVEDGLFARLGGLSDLYARGVSMVVDGLDEVDGARVDAILGDIRVFLAASRRSRVLVTSRTGVVADRPEDYSVPGLTDDSVQSIVALLTGTSTAYYSWPPSLRESARRPFFAIAASTAVRGGIVPRTPGDLVAVVVERALERGAARGVVSSESAMSLLSNLAAEITWSAGSSGARTLVERVRATETRLVVEDPPGVLRFGLPIIQQWFAAQSLRSGSTRVESIFADVQSFDRWRWAASVALPGAPSEFVDGLLSASIRLNPACTSWLLSQVQSSKFVDLDDTSVEYEESARRMLEANRSWVDGLGDLAEHVFPVSRGHGGLALGIRVERGWLTRAWSLSPSDEDRSEPLPPEVHPLKARHARWTATTSGRIPAGSHWPWILVHNDVRESLERVLHRSSAEIAIGGGVWESELRYAHALLLVGGSSFRRKPIDRATLLARLTDLFDTIPEGVGAFDFGPGRPAITLAEMRELFAWVELREGEAISSPLPEPDSLDSPGSWVWDAYSTGQTLKYAVELYGNACSAYDELTYGGAFSELEWGLASFQISPFGVLGSVSLASEGQFGPTVEFQLLPMEVLEEELAAAPGLHVRSHNGRCAMKMRGSEDPDPYSGAARIWSRVEAWRGSRAGASPFVRSEYTSSVLDFTGSRPASAVAAGWLWSDLKTVGMVSTGSPRFS